MKTTLYLFVAGLLLATHGAGLGQPIITVQPQTLTNCAGTRATFMVGATGTGTLTYQWQQVAGPEPVNLVGCTNQSLELTNLQVSDQSTYQVVVSDELGNTNSDVALLYVSLPPLIMPYWQPTNWSTVRLGAGVTNRVASGGILPVTYQWQFNGIPIPGQTKSAIILTNVQIADAGSYDVVVANGCGSTNSRTVTLVVDPSLITLIKITSGPVVTDQANFFAGSWADYDDDGFIDLFVPAGTDVLNQSPALYKNYGGTNFVRLTTKDVGAVVGARPYCFQGLWADFNNDGFLDLLEIGNTANFYASNRLFLGRSDRAFDWVRNVGENPAVGSWQCALVDYDNDGAVDVFHTTGYSAANTRDVLYRNRGDATFTKAWSPTGPLMTASQFACWADYDNDGDRDLWLLGLGPQGQFYRNNGNGTFDYLTDGSIPSPRQIIAAWGDYDNDGYLDCLNGTALFHNKQGTNLTLVYPDLAGDINLVAGRWADWDNDGDLDISIISVNGKPAKFLRNEGSGVFTVVDVGSPSHDIPANEFAMSWGDYDNDGFLDLFVATRGNPGGHNFLYTNSGLAGGNPNRWLIVKPRGVASNGSAIGAKVRVKATIRGNVTWQMREITGAYFDDLRAHFGLGDATIVDVLRIEWPSGNVQELTDVHPNQIMNVIEAVGITPTRPSASLNGSVALTRKAVAGATYQWQFEGADIIGQTHQTLNLTNIVASQQGHYSVVVSNATTLATNYVYMYVDTTFTKVTTGPAVTDLGANSLGAAGDYDGDGYPDLFVPRWNIGRSALYHNNGDGTFSAVTNTPLPQTQDAWNTSAWADLDNDGHPDLVTSRTSKPAVVYFNNGDGTFNSIQLPEAAPANVALIDLNDDGLLDMVLFGNSDFGQPAPSWFYRNNGNRTFTRLTSQQVGSLATLPITSGTCADYDDDGSVDMFCPNWSGASRLFQNDGTGRFVPVTNVVFQDSIVVGAWGDYDNDGRLDLCAVAYNGSTFNYHNLGGGQFERATIDQTVSSSYLSACWADYDNDGFLDLFLTSDRAGQNRLYHNNGDGAFSPVTTGSIVNDSGVGSWSSLWFDYDNDGFLDLYVFNNNAMGDANTANSLYHNNGNSNAWLGLKLIGTASNRDAVGAKVRVQARYAGQVRWQRRDISGGDVVSGSQPYAHFGLGDATNVSKVRIEWPSGAVEEFSNIAPRQFLTIVEPSLRGALGVDGKFHVSMTMSTNRVYYLETSSDLVNWTPLTNSTGSGSATAVEFVDPEAPSAHSARFYRMR